MFKHNLHIAWRQCRASLSYSLINLGGLTAGLTVALLIGLWIADELSFDHYFSNHNRIVKLIVTVPSDAGPVTTDLLSPPLVEELRANHYRFFHRLAIVFPNFPHALSTGQLKITAEGQWAQPDWPEILSLKMLRGSRNSLVDPSSTLIDHSTAVALFGTNDPMGATIRVDNSVTVKVAGIFQDLPANSSFAGTHILLAWNKAGEEMSWFKDVQHDWGADGFWIFGELSDPAAIPAIDKEIRNIRHLHHNDPREALSLYPMDRWHLYSEFRDGKSTTGRIRVVLLFTFIGIFVLLLACINFMNLSTAQSERRAREVGIRKTLGSLRYQLITQFLGESVFLAILALLLSIGIAQLSLPFFAHLAGKNLHFPYTDPQFWLLALGFTLFTGLISGSYPAFYLSHFKPIKTLAGRRYSANASAIARKSLVVLQFTVSVSLIIATAIIYRQIGNARARPIGYDRDGLITIRMSTRDIYNAPYNSLRDDLLRSGAVVDMAQSSNAATERPPDLGDISWEGKDPTSRPPFTLIETTHDFGPTIKWTIIAGRNFSREFTTDSNAILINESAARLIGFKDPGPVGKTLRFWGQDRRIIGVAKDIVNGSPYQPVTPTIFPLSYHDVNYITFRLNPTQTTTAALNTVAKVFRKYDPQSPFSPHFLADDYSLKFAAEQQTARLSTVFAILAIFISCLGLFGLASYMAEQRTKEIGIRKVLGASTTRLVTLLSIDFLKLILIALIIALPLSAWAMHQWLQSYPYRTHLSVWIFAATGTLTIGIALLTVSSRPQNRPRQPRQKPPLRITSAPIIRIFQKDAHNFTRLPRNTYPVLSTNKSAYTDLAVRMNPGQLVSAMEQMQQVFRRVIPSYLYNPVFFDDTIWHYYQKENMTAQLFRIFSVIAILLSGLGLYGLVSFMAVQKTREVGIRKVLGASVQSILYLFSKEFIFLIAIAFLITAPLGCFFMHRWLSGFQNHIEMEWSIFALAILISLGIACLTICYTTIRTAQANPVKSLRID